MTEPATISADPGAPLRWQDRLRDSRLGTLLVLAVTAVLVMAGVYLVNRPDAKAAGATAVAVQAADTAAPRVGSPAQDFTATTVDGEKVSLSGYEGKPVWLTFGASWCTACQAEAPDIEAAYQKFRDKGVVVLQVNISEDAGAAQDYATRVGMTYPVIADPDSVIAGEYHVSAIPAHFFIGTDGKLAAMKAGGLSPDAMTSALDGIAR